jgi:DNA-binding transcriptional ArsR family regulator
MPDSTPSPTPTPSLSFVDADALFGVLNDRTRRRILVTLFDGQLRAGRALGGNLSKQLDSIRKHCDVLVKAGLIVAEPDPEDGRRHAYKLAPTVKTETTPNGRTMDFGCCVVHC